MIEIKVGLGQTPSGKILDRDTHFYSITATKCEKQAALDYHDKTHKPIFISVSGKKYREINREELMELPIKHGRK